ncbi:MAG: response regulator [Spirochaetota bacterium]
MKEKTIQDKRFSVMIVDDSTDNLEVLSSALKEWGYRVRPATNGNQAIVAAQNELPDLILLDIMMPGLDGYETCKKLKENIWTKDVPVIFISAMDKMFDEIKGFSLGAVDYITKPVQLLVLKSRVDTHIQLKYHRDNLEKMVIERTKEIDSLLSSIKSILIGITSEKKITHWNSEAENVFKIQTKVVLGKILDKSIINWEWDRINKYITAAITEKNPVSLKEVRFSPSGDEEGLTRFLNIKISPIEDTENIITGYLITGEDITEVRSIRIQTNHAQKLEAIGRLAAGIAHEINTPAQYIKDNAVFTQESLGKLLDTMNKFIEFHKGGKNCDIADKIFDLLKSIDYEYLKNEVPKAAEQILEGINRITNISGSVKKFSHPGNSVKSLSDINKIIDDSVTISKNEWKYVSIVELDLDKNMKMTECYGDDLGRVFINIIINAAHAIEEKLGGKTEKKGTIKITTRYCDTYIMIKISDTGAGIPAEIMDRIFDPFFTTKEAGKGTGQGLAIAYDIIVNRHKGYIDVKSNPGEGTTFTITLPVKVTDD